MLQQTNLPYQKDNSVETMTSNYVSFINRKIRPIPNGTPLVLDLFAGCGGLALVVCLY